MMFFILCLLSGLLSGQGSFDEASEDAYISWQEDRKLRWSDFLGKPDPGSPNVALTHSTVLLDFGYNSRGMHYTIQCRFNKELSWTRMRTDYILQHEQLHFDIAEIHARLLHRSLSEYRFRPKTVGDDVAKIYQRVMDEHVGMQRRYDQETQHSIDTTAQRIWNEMIPARLQELAAYAGYGVHQNNP